MSVSNSEERRKKILVAIIETYIKTANQVSSRYIAKTYNFGLSPATIRNEMAELEEMGYLTHPHTSAGRVPTDKGYRYYIDNLMQTQRVTVEEIQKIEKNFKAEFKVLENIINETSNLLSELSHQTSIILYPKLDKSTFKHVELIHIQINKVLIVLMTNTGLVKNSIVNIQEDIKQEQLQKISNFLNYELKGMPLEDIEEYLNKKLIHEKDHLYQVFKDTIDLFRAILTNIHEDRILLEGIDHILENPEFEDIEKSKLLFKVIGKKKRLIDFLKKNLDTSEINIYIGKELPSSLAVNCSIITACYKIADKTVGSLGILGPTRMDYPRIVPIVKIVSELVTKTLTELEE